MTSHHDDSDEASNLGDSTYDFIDDRSLTATDDEEGDRLTESTTSSGDDFEGDRPVVVTALQHTPSHVQMQAMDAHFDNSPVSIRTPTYTANHHEARGSRVDKTGQETDDPQETIEFEEPSVIHLNSSRFTEVSHTLRILSGYEPMVVWSNHSAPEVHVTVRQTMSSKGLELKGEPYRLLFVGDRSFREPIVQKISTALAAAFRSPTPDSEDSQPTKFNIVPISAFGDSSNPEVVLIDSSGLELNVEDCIGAAFKASGNGKDPLRLGMADGKSVISTWTGGKFVYSEEWTRPDLAIFCMSDNESDSSKQIRRITRSFMKRHGVPSLAITKQALYDKQIDATTLATLDYLTPHICLETQEQSEEKSRVKRRLPIDLATFLNIDAGQMNRNLACLATSQRLSAPQAKFQAQKPENEDVFEAFKGFLGSLKSSFLPLFTSEATKVVAILCGGLLMAFLPLLIMSAFHPGNTEPSVQAEVASKAVSSTPIVSISMARLQASSSSTSTAVAISAASTPSQISSTKSLSTSTNTDIASFLLDAYAVGPDKSENFNVHVLGDCHIVLRPPHWFTKLRKAPTLLFKISREDIALEHTVSTLFEGVYALQVPREEAYGLLDVSVSTLAKPIVEETFEVDFGSSWLKIAAWKRATRAVTEAMHSDLSLIYSGVSVIYNQTKTELSTFVEQTKTIIAAQRKNDHALLASRLNWTAQTKDLSRNMSLKYHRRQKEAAKHIQSLTKDVCRSISIYTHDTTNTFSHRARVITQTIKHFKLKSQAYNLHMSRPTNLRAAQKKALKVWYSLAGFPKRKPEVRETTKLHRGRKAERTGCEL